MNRRTFREEWIKVNKGNLNLREREYYLRDRMHRISMHTAKINAQTLKKVVMDAMTEHHTEKFLADMMETFLKETLQKSEEIEDSTKNNMEEK